ncbi:MAG: T9SS type A sorting domain-containing protein [bacterium]|nr:T9SS type A sorting domain-containing protein [bacterium]
MRFLTSAFALFILTAGFTQVDYFANNPEWNQASSCTLDGCVDYRDFVYYINGDSTINALTYKKCFKRGQSVMTDGPTGPACGPQTTYDDLAYLVRQDGYQVHLWNGTNDTLLYDFDVAVGDTFPVAYNVCDRYIVLDSVEQITFGGQQRRKLYFTETTTGSFSNMIEGVGWPGGFFEPVCDQPNCGYQFNCFSLNGQVLLGTNCFFEASVLEQKGEELLNIRPNPMEDEFCIDIPKGKILRSVHIADPVGVLVKVMYLKYTTGTFCSAVENLPPGNYLLGFEFTDGEEIQTKVVKK